MWLQEHKNAIIIIEVFMKNKELCILIILLILLKIVIMILEKTNYTEFPLYNKDNIIIDCEEKEMIACKISYNFPKKIDSLHFFIDYGSGLDLIKVNSLNGYKHDGNYYYINYFDTINKDNYFIIYFKTNNIVNETNKYMALQNINVIINNNKYHINDIYNKIN